MHIQKITSRNRRDFHAVFVCEHCGATREGGGYDDANFHNCVIPHMKCPACGKVASDSYRPHSPRYPADAVI